MIHRCFKLSLATLLLPLLAACGAAQHGSIDDSKPVCPEGQVWDGTQCSEDRGIVMPERSGGEGSEAAPSEGEPSQ